MQNSQLDRLLKLAKRTGDRLIVTGNDGSEPVVILPLSEYEGMLDSMTFFRAESTIEEEIGQPARGLVEETEEVLTDPEGDFDQVALERQVMAAMPQEEPRMVPVEPTQESRTPENIEESPRKPITRRGTQVDDGGEERFYLEAV